MKPNGKVYCEGLTLVFCERQDIDEQEIVRRMRAIYTPQQMRDRLSQWAMWRRQGLENNVQKDLSRLSSRMYDMSQYMKTLMQRYSQWYNRQAARRGTLWEERFKSVVVEGSSIGGASCLSIYT